MEPGNDTEIFTLKMDRTIAEVTREGLDIKKDQTNVDFISGMNHGYINLSTSYQ